MIDKKRKDEAKINIDLFELPGATDDKSATSQDF